MGQKTEYWYGLGRRKRASARVRLSRGQGRYTINDRSEALPQLVRGLFELLHLEAGGFSISVKVNGGGAASQSAAIRLGLSRALVRLKPELRTPLRLLGELTRDPREKERKKPGLKRARRAPQFAKR